MARTAFGCWAWRNNLPRTSARNRGNVERNRIYISRGQMESVHRDTGVLWHQYSDGISYFDDELRRAFFPGLAPGDLHRITMRRLADKEPPHAPGRSIVGQAYAGHCGCGNYIIGITPEIMDLTADRWNDPPDENEDEEEEEDDYPCYHDERGNAGMCHSDIQAILSPEISTWRNGGVGGVRAIAFRLEVVDAPADGRLRSQTAIRDIKRTLRRTVSRGAWDAGSGPESPDRFRAALNQYMVTACPGGCGGRREVASLLLACNRRYHGRPI